MIKRIKTMLGNIIAATISILILCSWFVLPFEAQSTVPTAPRYTAPSAGAGRITRMVAEEMHDDEQVTGTLESSTETLVLQAETETEDVFDAVSANYEQVTVNETEEWVECVPEVDPVIETDIDALIVQVAAEYGLPWQLVRAVVWAESTFDPFAVSDHPDYGLMQVWEQIWVDYGYDPKDPIVYDPETNLRMGCQVLKQKIDAHDGDFANALTCYRFGDGGALEKWRQGEYSNWYNERVLGKYYEYLRGDDDGNR